MLGKLLKYDLKWVYKLIVVFYILAFIFSVIGRALSGIENSLVFNVASKISFGFAISMIVSSLINCLMRLWVRFVRNVYKDESYLTHTLPVEKKDIFASKVITGLICIFTTTVVVLGCLAICYYSKENIEILKTILELAATTYNTTVINLLLVISMTIFTEIIFILVIGYVGIILGHKSNKNKMALSIVFSFVIYMIFQWITLGIIFIGGVLNPDIMNLINTTEMVNVDTIKLIMYMACAIYGVYTIVLYFIGKKQLEKGVNVE